MRAAFVIVLLLGFAAAAQVATDAGRVARMPNLERRVWISDPHSNPNAETGIVPAVQETGLYEVIGTGNRFGPVHTPISCPDPDPNLIKILQLLTDEQSVQNELASEKNQNKCGDDAIMDKITGFIHVYRRNH